MRRFRVKRFHIPAAAAVLLLPFAAFSPAAAGARAGEWVGTWASAQIAVDPPNALPAAAREDSTLRQILRVTEGGSSIRVRISNVFGRTPLTITGVDVARAISPASARIDPASESALTFSGNRMVIIPAGAEYVSDPVAMPVAPLTSLAISLHYARLPDQQSGHPGSRATSYVAPGDQVAASDLAGATAVERWYFLSEVDVQPATRSAAIAVLGDSITDGHGVVTNSNGRWTDVLAQRLEGSPATRSLSVLNLGIGGNRLVDDGIGPNAAARFGRDILERSGVKYLIILEGVNDLGVLTRDHPATPEQHRTMVARMIGSLQQMIARAHERAIKVIGGTIMPYGRSGYYHPGAADEADRQLINAWIRAPGHFDALVDFDALMRDPAKPNQLRKDYDLGDGLHPSPAGYRAMGEAVPLSLFRSPGK